MPLIVVPLTIQMSSLTQAEENTLAGTLTTESASTIWNNELLKIRFWNGTAFETAPVIPETLLPPLTGGSVPVFIPSTVTFQTTQYQQSLALLPIDSEGTVDISFGILAFL